MKVTAKLLSMLMVLMVAMMISVNNAEAEGSVDWNNSVVTATAIGVYPPNAVSQLQAVGMAKIAAKAIAQRDLLAALKGVNIDSETTVENMIATSDIIRTRVQGCLHGAVVVSERELPGGYEVTMQVPLFGTSNSVAPIVIQRPTTRTSFPQPVQSVEPAQPVTNINITINNTNDNESSANTTNTNDTDVSMPSKPSVTPSTKPAIPTKPSVKLPSTKPYNPSSAAVGGFTGLIVDCRGLGLKPVMSPVVKNENGEPIYGYKNLDYDKIIEIGMAGYSTDTTNVARAGSNPLVVRAVKIDGSTKGNPVISVADANRVLIENNASGFLDKMNVVFLY